MSRPPHARLFLDAGPLIAYVSRLDPDHEKALDLLRRVGAGEWASTHTSDYVLAKALNYVRRKIKRRDAAEALVTLVFGAENVNPLITSIRRIHSGAFARALEHYRNDFDRGLSLTDWTNVVAMQDAGISHIATFDGGFHGLVEVVDMGA